MKTLLTLLALALLTTGCWTRKLYFVTPGKDVIRLGKSKGEYFVQDARGEWVRFTGPLPVGWYAMQDERE
jgi:hypothetical protein